MENFAAPAATAPATLPADIALAAVATRPPRRAGTEPRAAVLLVEFEVLETAG